MTGVNTIENIENLISNGRYLEARHAAELLRRQGSNLRVDQLYALALSKSGAIDQARQFIEPVYNLHQDDPETAGIMGSIYKALFKKNQQSFFALLARDTYLKNFATTKSHYTGINAASMSAMIMHGAKCKEIARGVIGLIIHDSNDFWELATLGEANLLIKESEKAIGYYVKARKLAGNDWGKINSVYDQLWLLNHYLPVPKEVIRLFSPPGVIAFVGHMIDHPSRSTPRFPSYIANQIKDAIVSNLKIINGHVGFCSLACGSDILFAEAMASMNREVNILLPFNVRDFIEISVRFAGEDWVSRFQSLIETHPVKIVTEEAYAGYDSLFNFQSKLIFGSTLLRSQAQESRTTLLTVLSETDLKKRIGGTNYSIGHWPFTDKHININPDIFLADAVWTSPSSPDLVTTHYPTTNRKLWHHVAVNVSGLAPLYVEKIQKALIRSDSETMFLITHEILEDLKVSSFESEFEAFACMHYLQDVIKTFPKDQLAGICLHSGLSTLLAQKLSGEGIETVVELSRLNVPGLHASEHAAALLALQPDKYSLEFAGSVVLREKNLEVYRVNRTMRS